MINIDKVCLELSRELNISHELVKQIVMYQFQFITEVMKDPDDYHDILLNKLFRFKLKPRFKDNKIKDYSPKL